MTSSVTTNDNYWSDYDGLQDAKHQMLTAYLGAWFPILSAWSGQVLYIDCHAGRGRHKTGHEGSPILALKTLVQHRSIDQILGGTEVTFVFIEKDKENFELLQAEITALGTLPKGINVLPYQEDYETVLRKMLKDLKESRKQLPPAFAFVDPYGFNLPMDLLNEYLKHPASELVVNLMFRHVDMSIHNSGQAANMDKLFGTAEWRELATIADPDIRSTELVAFYSKQLKAEHVTQMNMYADNGTLKYVLLHATNHDLGREKMKEAIWKITPDGSFAAFERDDPDQMVLIRAEPDLIKLENRLWASFAGKTVDTAALYEWLTDELFLKKHLHEVLRRLKSDGIIDADGYEGKFAFKSNPKFTFPSSRPS